MTSGIDQEPEPEIGGYRFRDPTLLQAALTHPSVLQNRRQANGIPYERLEFLGDRVLGLAMADALYHAYPKATEGELAKRQAVLVRRETLAEVAMNLGLLERLALASSDREAIVSTGRGQSTILGDAMEALLGALYLDSDQPTAAAFIGHHFADAIAAHTRLPGDPKTGLQEWVQGRGHPLPTYTIVAQTGPSHAPRFTVAAAAAGQSVEATGGSKQEAEKAAATLLLERLST